VGSLFPDVSKDYIATFYRIIQSKVKNGFFLAFLSVCKANARV
jgi:hypothetical protein